MTRKIILLGALLLLAACNDQKIEVAVPPPQISKELRSCKDAPTPPSAKGTQKEAAVFTKGLAVAYKDCKSKLRLVNKALDNYEAQ